jgi:hypothetical protein
MHDDERTPHKRSDIRQTRRFVRLLGRQPFLGLFLSALCLVAAALLFFGFIPVSPNRPNPLFRQEALAALWAALGLVIAACVYLGRRRPPP